MKTESIFSYNRTQTECLIEDGGRHCVSCVPDQNKNPLLLALAAGASNKILLMSTVTYGAGNQH